MDPSTLLASDEEVLAAVRTLDEFKRGSADAIKLSNDELWAAQKLKDSAIHPDTGDLIPRPVRMAGYGIV
jgi:rhodanese-related sulfurtransferase